MRRRFSIPTLALAAALGLTPLGTSIPCAAQGAGRAALVTPGQRAAALAGAQALVGRAAKAKSLKGMAGVLTNRSAGALGVMMAGMMGAGIGLGGDMSGGQGASPSGGSQARTKARYDALMKRWGVAAKGPSMPSVPPSVAKDGRGFLADVAALMDSLGPDGEEVSAGGDFSARDVSYTVLSPTRVRLGMKPKAGRQSMPPAEAVLEGGQWRLDLGDLKTMSSHTGG